VSIGHRGDELYPRQYENKLPRFNFAFNVRPGGAKDSNLNQPPLRSRPGLSGRRRRAACRTVVSHLPANASNVAAALSPRESTITTGHCRRQRRAHARARCRHLACTRVGDPFGNDCARAETRSTSVSVRPDDSEIITLAIALAIDNERDEAHRAKDLRWPFLGDTVVKREARTASVSSHRNGCARIV